MNNDRRKQIDEAIALLETMKDSLENARSLIETAKDDEQEYFDNMPEGFQQSEKGENAEAAISALDSAYDALDIDLDDVINNLEEAKG